MKKVALFVSLMFVALSVAAQPTSTSRITLKASGQTDKEINFLIVPGTSDAFDNTWDTEAVNAGGIYVVSNGTRYTTWASNAYSQNLVIGFNTTRQNTSYTLVFANPTYGTLVEYNFFDLVTGESFVVNSSTPNYQFTVDESDLNKSITDRFLINMRFDPDNEPLDLCFNEKGDNVLEIKKNPYDNPTITVLDKDGNHAGRSPYVALNTPQKIDLSSLAAGRYTLVFGSGDNKKELIIVK